MKKYKSYLLFLIGIIMLLCVKVYAKSTYDLNFKVYNITSEACNLSDDYGSYDCFLKYLDGDLEGYLLTNTGNVEPGQTIMVVPILSPSSSSDLVGIKATIKTDSSKLTQIRDKDADGEDAGIIYLTSDLGIDYEIYPYKTSKGKKSTTWGTDEPPYNYVDNETIQIIDTDSAYSSPLVNDAPLAGIFYTVNETIDPGSSFSISYDSKLTNTNATDTSMKPFQPQIENFTLNVLSNGSTSSDGTLATLTATGSNSLDYSFGFVPSDKTKLDYDFKVPYAVDKITFTGTPTDSNAKDTVGFDTPHNLNVGDNPITLTITAESGDITTYKIIVRRLSNDATLSSITGTNSVSFGTLSPTTFTYSVTVPYKTTTTNISATTTHSEASIPSSEIGNWIIETDNQTNKKNTYNIEVSAEDCKYTTTQVPGNVCTKQPYTFEITRTAPSKDLTLSDLKVDGTTIPGFSPSQKEYTLVNATANKSSITITATLNDNKNSITSGTGTKTVNVGDNKYEIIITSEDGVTTDKYTINLHRLSDESRLQTLTVSSNPNGTLSPSFNTDFHSTTGEYTYSFDPNVTTIAFSATVKDTGKAYVRIYDAYNTSNTANTSNNLNSATTTFNNTTTKVNVEITAEDGTIKTYVINLSRQKSTNNYLSSLTITPGTIKETFSPSTGTYTAEVEPDVTSVTVNAVLEDPVNATLGTITGNTNFSFGAGNIISIPVISESKQTNTYTINVTRKEYNIATLDDIRIGYGTDTPTKIAGYNKNTLKYNVNVQNVNAVPYDTKSIKIEYDKTNEYSTVTGDVGTKSLSTGENTFTITVTSQDKTKTNSYELKIYRNKNSDNETKGVTVAGIPATPVDGQDNTYEVTLGNEKTQVTAADVIISASDDATVNKITGTLNLSTENVNIYNYSIKSEDGTTKNYTIRITREKSNNANITRVDLGIAGDSTPRYCVFNTNETTCTIQVPTATTKYTLSATIDPKATISPVNGTEYEMTSYASDSIQTRTLVVTAEDDSTKTYTVTVERAKSADANLSAITLTNVTGGKSDSISFSAFQENKTSYNITVNSDVEKILIGTTLKDPKARIDTDLSNPFTLEFGLNQPITIDVVAEDGTTTKQYTLNITRSKGTDKSLKDLKVNGTTITEFTPSSSSYIYSNVSYETTSLSIEGITNDSNAKVIAVLINSSAQTITASNDVTSTVNLKTGLNTIIVRVQAHDESIDPRDYTITIERDKNNNNAINGIKFKKKDGTTITATFDPSDPTKYKVTVPNDETIANDTNVIVDLPSGETSTDPLATIIMTSTNLVTNNPATSNVNTHTFIVTAENGDSQTYTLEITREKNNNVELTRVYSYADSSSSYSSFCENLTSASTCKLTVPVSTTSFRLEGVLAASTSTVVFKENGVLKTTFDMSSSQSGSSKNIIATVTAENGDTQNYDIIVERALSSNAALKGLETDADNEGTLSPIIGYTDTKTLYELELNANPFTQDTFKVSIATYDAKSKIISINSTGTIKNTTSATPDVAIVELDLSNPGTTTTINFTIEAEDGTSIPYTIKVNRPKNKEPRLSGITINNDDINNYLTSPTTFDNDRNKDIESTQYVYDLDFTSLHSASSTATDKTMLPNSYHTLNIQATKMDSEAGSVGSNGTFQMQTIYYNGNTNYINQVKIISCAQDDSICKTYTLNIRRQPNSNTDLADWDTAVKVSYKDDGATETTLHNATYDRTQSAGKNNRVYTITVPNSVTEINESNLVVSVADGLTEWDQLATVAVPTTELSTKTIPNIVNFTVTAEDGTIETYTLQVTREESNFAALATLSVVDPETNQVIGTFNKTFKEDSNVDAEYTINIPEGTTRYKIVATASDNGTVTGNGTFTMNASTEERIVYAHSENKTATTTYKLNIVRSSNDNKNLLSLVVEDKDGNTYTVTPDVLTTEGVFSEIYDYNVTVPGSVEKVIVTATPESPLSKGVSYLGADADTTNTYSVSVGDNTIRFNVRSEAGNEQSYTLKVIREQKNENRLKALSYTLSDGTTASITLEDNKYDYTIPNVANDITKINFIATKMDNDATVTGLGEQAITTGPNKFTITVKAQNGDEQEYTISVNRAQSDDARLKMFSLTGTTFNENFELGENNVETVVYTVTVPETKEKIGQNDITAIPNHSNATISYDPEINLSTNGINFYGVTVKAENGREKRYEIRITRPKSTDALLKEVELDGATIQPEFNPTTNEYTITVPLGKTDFTITGIPNVSIATVIGNGTHSISENSFTIMVQAEDPDVSINIYKFNIVQAKSTDASLSNLGVQGYPLTPTFVKTTTSYTIGNIEASISQVIMNATPTNIDSTVEYYSDGEKIATCESKVKCTVPLKPGLGTKYLVAKVIAPDGISYKEYNVSYTKVNSSDAFLDSITADVGTFDKEFNQATSDYTLKVPYEKASVNLTITTSHSDASIKVNTDEPVYSPKLYNVSNIPAGGSKAVTILVTAQDGTTTKTYNVIVERAAYVGSTDAYLSSLAVKDYPLKETFNANKENYSIGQIPYSLSELTILATPNVSSSTIEYFVNGAKQSSNKVTIPKQSGTITVKVTAEDNRTVKNYTITYTKQASDNTYLKSITVNKGQLSPSFNKNTGTYNVTIPNEETSIDIMATAEDANATIKINGNTYIAGSLFTLSKLSVGTTDATIIVTAEDGKTTQTYKVKVTREGIDEVITSKQFGHDISDGYIKTVAALIKVSDMKNQLDNDNAKLEIWNASNDTKLADDTVVGTGMIVKLVIDGTIADSKIIVVKGDVNGDSEINVIDASAIVNHFLGRSSLTGAYLVASDTNIDTEINVIDASAIVNHFLGRTLIKFK